MPNKPILTPQLRELLTIARERVDTLDEVGYRPLAKHHTAHSVTLLFTKIVGKLPGMPRSIVSDRDPLFISKLW